MKYGGESSDFSSFKVTLLNYDQYSGHTFFAVWNARLSTRSNEALGIIDCDIIFNIIYFVKFDWFICTMWSVCKYDIWSQNWLLDGESVYNQIAAYINTWLEPRNLNQDG